MKTKIIAAGAVLGLSLFAASQASATIVTVTVTGDVATVNNSTGQMPTGVQAGDAFKAVFTFDTDQPHSDLTDIGLKEIYGGSYFGYPAFGTAHVEAGNLSYDLTGNFEGDFHNYYGTTLGELIDYLDASNQKRFILDSAASSLSPIFSMDLTQPGDYFPPENFSTASLSIYGDLVYDDNFISSETYIGSLAASISHVIVANGTSGGGGSDDNAIPEPASLSLFAAALIGAPFFRRKKNKQDILACAGGRRS